MLRAFYLLCVIYSEHSSESKVQRGGYDLPKTAECKSRIGYNHEIVLI